jgi:hypothetical protein
VVILAGLLFLCLMAPRYWQSSVVQNDSAIGVEPDIADDDWTSRYHVHPFDHTQLNPAGRFFNLDGVGIGRFTGGSNTDLLNAWALPPLEELVAARTAMAHLSARVARVNADGFDWPLVVRAAMEPIQNDEASSESGPVLTGEERPSREFAAPFERIGQLAGELATLSNVFKLGEVASRFTDGVPQVMLSLGDRYELLMAAFHGGRSIASHGPALVRVTGPDDRLAMLVAPPAPVRPWCVPQTLLEELERLAGQPESAQWASQVRNQLRALTERPQLDGDDVQIIMADLSEAAQEAEQMANEIDNDQLRVELLRVHWGLARRLDCWGAMHEKRIATHFESRVAARGPLNPYLKGGADPAVAPMEITALGKELEQYEISRDTRLARQIAVEKKSLQSSADAADRAVADSVEQHYRNANLRIAITAEMLNRLAGVERDEWQPVNSQIAGAYVHGQSNVHSQSHVLLDPSGDEWLLELKADGVVDSNTLANSGPVRFRSRGTTDFTGRKQIVVNDKGVHLRQSDTSASNSSRLVGVTTDYDWMPIIGGMARDRAISEYRSRQGHVRSQIEDRVAAEARETLDQQTKEAVDQIRKQTYDRFASELDAFDIKLTPIEMKTTAERLVARLRVAGDKQLGSHTPRPRALSDSLASAQVHETALTNLAITLGLDGKRFTAPELRNMLREKFPQLATRNPTVAKQETIFQFAAEDAVQVHINDGRLELAIAFDSIELDGDVMRGVVIHAYYTPKIDGLNAELVRDGSLGVEGRFSAGDRARLHNIFNRVLPEERHLPVVRIENANDKRFKGLMITQLVLEDGWAGLAVGPATEARVAERVRSLK